MSEEPGTVCKSHSKSTPRVWVSDGFRYIPSGHRSLSPSLSLFFSLVLLDHLRSCHISGEPKPWAAPASSLSPWHIKTCCSFVRRWNARNCDRTLQNGLCVTEVSHTTPLSLSRNLATITSLLSFTYYSDHKTSLSSDMKYIGFDICLDDDNISLLTLIRCTPSKLWLVDK